MKKSIILAALAALLTCLAAAPASAQQLKIATVNMKSVFDRYYKKQQADETFKTFMEGLQKQQTDLRSMFQKAQTDYKSLLEKANDQAVSSDERDKGKKAAEAKLSEVKELEESYQQFMSSARTRSEEKQRQLTEKLVEEIKDAVSAKAKAGLFSMVVDVSAIGINGMPIVLYTNGDNDLTASVLDQLNAAAAVLSGPAGKVK
jgi:Skp family chaperone for outer membrane proteins